MWQTISSLLKDFLADITPSISTDWGTFQFFIVGEDYGGFRKSAIKSIKGLRKSIFGLEVKYMVGLASDFKPYFEYKQNETSCFQNGAISTSKYTLHPTKGDAKAGHCKSGYLLKWSEGRLRNVW